MWKWKSDWDWCLGRAYFLAQFQAGGAYSGGAYKNKRVPDNIKASKSFESFKSLPFIFQKFTIHERN